MNRSKELEKLKTNLLKQCISKDETRLQLQGVCHVSSIKALCSTDGHIACVLKSRYSESLADKIINPITFELIEREYPKIDAIIPTTYKATYTFSIEKIHYFNCKAYKPIKAHFYKDGTISIEDVKENKEKLFTVNSNFLKHLVDRTYSVGFSGDLSPIVFSLLEDNFDDIFIIMPLKL